MPRRTKPAPLRRPSLVKRREFLTGSGGSAGITLWQEALCL